MVSPRAFARIADRAQRIDGVVIGRRNVQVLVLRLGRDFLFTRREPLSPNPSSNPAGPIGERQLQVHAPVNPAGIAGNAVDIDVIIVRREHELHTQAERMLQIPARNSGSSGVLQLHRVELRILRRRVAHPDQRLGAELETLAGRSSPSFR